MIARRSHDEETFLKSTNLAAESAWCRKFSTQIGASALTTAVCARSCAIRSAVLPSVHPKYEKPITDIATAPITPPQIPGFKLGYLFIYRAFAVRGRFPLIFPPRIAALREHSSGTRQDA
jgi:hypothetical protein